MIDQEKLSQPPGQDRQKELQQPEQPHQLPIPLQQPVVHQIPPVPQKPIPPAPIAMNWSYFKAELSGKPEEDPETLIPRIDHSMNTHNFAVYQRV